MTHLHNLSHKTLQAKANLVTVDDDSSKQAKYRDKGQVLLMSLER